VEFALVSGLFLLLLMGVIQYGIYINATSAVVNVAREGARYSAVTAAASNSADQQSVHDHVTAAGVLPPQLLASAIPLSNVKVEYFKSDGVTGTSRSIGNMVRVSISYDMRGKMFMPHAFIGPLFKDTYTAVSSFRIEQ